MALHRIIIDCDPGQDDAVALLLALASPDEIEVLAVTAVAGNVPLALTEANARRIVELAGRPDIRVHKGCHRPLVKRLETAEYVHGETGLNGVELPPPSHPLAPGHAVDAIIELVMAAEPKTVTLCPVGPLTNIAMALVKEPALAARLCQIVLMGGAIGLGNVTPAAEFNIYVDPHAARVVFESGVPITMFGLDVTHQVLVTRPRLEAFAALGTRTGTFTAEMLDFFERFDIEKYGSEGGPLHDPTTIAYLLRPELFSGRFINVEIETGSALTRGMTVADWWGVTDRAANATFIGDVDAAGFFSLLVERLGRLP